MVVKLKILKKSLRNPHQAGYSHGVEIENPQKFLKNPHQTGHSHGGEI